MKNFTNSAGAIYWFPFSDFFFKSDKRIYQFDIIRYLFPYFESQIGPVKNVGANLRLKCVLFLT